MPASAKAGLVFKLRIAAWAPIEGRLVWDLELRDTLAERRNHFNASNSAPPNAAPD